MKLLAEFETDADGMPISASGNKKAHYGIRLYLVDVPRGVERVSYRLHKSYIDPIRKVGRSVPRFEEEITSYGDYEIVVDYKEGDEPQRMREHLSNALKIHYEQNPPGSAKVKAAVEEAIAQIRDN